MFFIVIFLIFVLGDVDNVIVRAKNANIDKVYLILQFFICLDDYYLWHFRRM